MAASFTKCAPGMGTRPRFVRVERDDDIECTRCGDTMPRARRDKLNIKTCLSCSVEVPKQANLAQHKQAYGYHHDPKAFQDNPYSTHK